jgi:hypothetical protein
MVGIAVAAVASSLFPPGLAGKLEPNPGIDIDPAILLLGGLAFIVLIFLRGSVAAWLESGRRRTQIAAAGISPRFSSPSLSMALAFATNPGRGVQRVPLRPAIAGSALGIAGVIGALTFAASLGTLVETPRLYGDAWDLQIPLQVEGSRISDRELPGLVADPRIKGVSRYRLVEMSLGDGKPLSGDVLEPFKGEVGPTLLRGRLPSEEGEIAIKATDAEERGLEIGREIDAKHHKKTLHVKVVGMLPGTSFTGFVIGPESAASLAAREFDEVGLLVEAAPGVSISALKSDLQDTFSEVYEPVPPPPVENLRGVRDFPRWIAAFLAVLGLAAVGHLLVTAVRRRSRELAILKVIGFDRAQMRTTVILQALLVTVLGVLIGAPLGLAVGRTAWTIVTSQIQAVNLPNFPIADLSIIVPVALVFTAFLSLLPANRAATVSPATILHSE